MDCYTVNEEVNKGIRMRVTDEGEPYIPIGDVQLRVCDNILQGVSRVVEAIEDEHELSGVLKYSGLALTTASLRRLSDGTNLVCKDSKVFRNPTALVLLETHADSLEDRQLTSRNFTERQHNSHKPWSPVRRSYNSFPPTGVRVICNCGFYYLLSLAPGSGFRIKRSGELDKELSRVFHVNWFNGCLTMTGS